MAFVVVYSSSFNVNANIWSAEIASWRRVNKWWAQFTNAPCSTVNNGKSLFDVVVSSYNSPNGVTLFELLQWINDPRVWDGYKKETHAQNSNITTDTYYLFAKNFGKLNDGSASANGGTANPNAQAMRN